MVVLGKSKQKFELGDAIASGGEGSIHNVVGHPEWVAKIYTVINKSSDAENLELKVAYMVSHKPEIGANLPDLEHPYWTWPLEPLFSNDTFVGYIMPKLSGNKGEEFLQLTAGFDWKTRLVACRNLTALIQATHEAGYIVGDLNPRNLFFSVSKTSSRDMLNAALSSLTDTDSFQVGGVNQGEVLFACKVQNPEYSAPELIESLVRQRTVEQDYFTLAIVLFQILSLGVHPFSGTVAGSANQEIRLNIMKGRNVLFSKDIKAPKAMIPLEIFPPEMIVLFERTFRKGHTLTKSRASTQDWLKMFDELIAGKLLVCNQNQRHVYSQHLANCPWCDYAKRLNFDPFQPTMARLSRPLAPKIIGDVPLVNQAEPPLSPQTQTPETASSTNTLFGPIPDYLDKNMSDSDSSPIINPVKKPAPPKPKKHGGRYFLLGLIGLLMIGFAAWFFVAQQKANVFAAIPKLLEQFQQKETDTPIFPDESELVITPFTLSIRVCVDHDAPFDCSGLAQPIQSGFVISVQGVQKLDKIISETMTVYAASELPANQYVFKLDESAFANLYGRCPTEASQITLPSGSTRLKLEKDTLIVIAYCERETS